MSSDTVPAATGNGASAIFVQPEGFLLELTPDWIIRRSSANAHAFLGEYPQALIGEPLASVTMAQPLHDVRNLFSRQSRGGRVARAYRSRLMQDPRHFDFLFQHCEGHLLLEGVESSSEAFGASFGSIAGLADGLGRGDSFLDDVARRLRALTGYDRVTIDLDGQQARSSRGEFAERPSQSPSHCFVGDTSCEPVAMFPAGGAEELGGAILRSPSPEVLAALHQSGIGAMLDFAIMKDGEQAGWVRCDNRVPRPVNLELHAAAELFAQIALQRG